MRQAECDKAASKLEEHSFYTPTCITQGRTLLDIIVDGNGALDQHQEIADCQVHDQYIRWGTQRFTAAEHEDDEGVAKAAHHRDQTVQSSHDVEGARVGWLELQPERIHFGNVCQIVLVVVVYIARV